VRLPLAFLPENAEAIVVEVRGGMGIMRRLLDLGLTPGAKVKVIHSGSAGPVLIEVRGSRVMVGRGILMKIIVEWGGSP